MVNLPNTRFWAPFFVKAASGFRFHWLPRTLLSFTIFLPPAANIAGSSTGGTGCTRARGCSTAALSECSDASSPEADADLLVGRPLSVRFVAAFDFGDISEAAAAAAAVLLLLPLVVLLLPLVVLPLVVLLLLTGGAAAATGGAATAADGAATAAAEVLLALRASYIDERA